MINFINPCKIVTIIVNNIYRLFLIVFSFVFTRLDDDLYVREIKDNNNLAKIQKEITGARKLL